MPTFIDALLTGNISLMRATEELRRGDAVIEGENAEIANQAVDAAAYALNHRSEALLNFWGGMRINGVVVRQPDDMNLTSLQSQAVAHAERLRTLHDRRIEDELVNELRSVVDNVLGGAPEPPAEVLRYLQRHQLSPLQQMEEVVIAARLAHELERLTEDPPTLNGSPVTSTDEAPADPITMPSLEAAMLQSRINANERLHRRAGISPEEPAPPIMPSQEEFGGFIQLLNEPLPDAPTLSPEMGDEVHRRIIAAEALLRVIGIDPAAEHHAMAVLNSERLTDEPGEMVATECQTDGIVPRPKGCPQCGGKLQYLSNDNTFCLDCDWDNMDTLPETVTAKIQSKHPSPTQSMRLGHRTGTFWPHQSRSAWTHG